MMMMTYLLNMSNHNLELWFQVYLNFDFTVHSDILFDSKKYLSFIYIQLNMYFSFNKENIIS